MIVDWLTREGGIVLSWWLLVTLAGLAVWPLLLRLLRGLPDRGFLLARAAGMLVVGFVFWLLASLGLLRNTAGGILFAWLLVLVIGLVIYFQHREAFDWARWWQQHRTAIIVGEVLFAVLLLAFAIYRAHLPNLTGTEKPMELAFMSAVQRSDVFPPNDPWLSGYAISYYYFGYVQSAMLSLMSGILSTVGFNMTISLLFALTGLTSYGVVYNLVVSRLTTEKPQTGRTAVFIGLLGMIFVVLLGNFQLPLIEMPYQTRTATDDYLKFWGQSERLQAKPPLPEVAGQAITPDQWDFWWWFRASRVVTDTNLDGTLVGVQPIDEFPAFSFVLADVHPHVLALPYAMLALGLALNVVLTRRDPTRAEVFFYGLALGGLVFLNTWDGPIYMVVLVGADGLRRLMRNGTGSLRRADWWGMFRLGGALLGLTLVLYLPFIVSFRSQASGVLPNLLHPTSFQQYFVMFGPFMLLLAGWLLLEVWQARTRMNWRLGLIIFMAAVVILIGLMALFIGYIALLESMDSPLPPRVADFITQNGGLEAVLPLWLERRVAYAGLALVLLAGISLIVARLFPQVPQIEELELASDEERLVINYQPATGFALLLAGAALVLTLVPEFFYLRDNFGVRINTIFKFYYQAWLMFSVVGAYAVFMFIADARFQGRLVAMALVVTIMGLLYPILGATNRMFIESGRAANPDPPPLTLDGGNTLVGIEDYLAITCLGELVDGDDVVAVEALGPAYNSGYGRVGALTGIPIVLGWENHQGQWRGPTYGQVVGTRPNDIRDLYTDLRWEVAQTIIERYGIDYIFFGASERSQYGVQGEVKFADNLQPVCEFGNSRFYRVDAANMVAQG